MINPKVKKVVQNFASELEGKRIVLGVSGGADSQCLLFTLAHLLPKSQLVAVGVNHGLRPEADAELDLAEMLATGCGVRFARESVSVARGGNVQARARAERYRALERHGDIIVTAHTFNDKAETVLLNLLRGSGTKNLGTLPYFNNGKFRPMLDCTRDEVERHLKHFGIKWASDPSNQNTKYTRVWVRKVLIPMLETKNPRIQNRLVDIANELFEQKAGP